MDFHNVCSRKLVMLDNSNRLCIEVRRIDVNIQHMDFQAVQAYSCTLVDDFFLHSVHFQHMNRHHILSGTHDSIDRMLHHPNNPHYIDKFHVHTILTGFLVFQPGKYSLLDDFVPNIRLHDHIEFLRMYMD